MSASKNPTLIVVSGPPAAGKTTIAAHLAKHLRLPVFYKDALKERLADQFGCSTRDESTRLGIASIYLLYDCVETLLAAGSSCIAEMNFRAEYDAPRIQSFATRHDCGVIQVYCYAPDFILRRRYKERALSGDRHPAHFDMEVVEEMGRSFPSRDFDALPVSGPTIFVDTTTTESSGVESLPGRVSRLMSRSPADASSATDR